MTWGGNAATASADMFLDCVYIERKGCRAHMAVVAKHVAQQRIYTQDGKNTASVT
jgi:hypothetical protein